MKRRIAFILAALMLANVSLVACSENTVGDETQSAVAESSISPEAEVEAETTEEDLLYGSLTPKDYEGYTFRFLTSASNYGITYMDVEGMTGDIVNDTVYERNRAIEKELNITVFEEGGLNYDQPVARLKTMVAAGDDEFDVIFSEGNYAAPIVADNYMHNLYDIEGINWDNPWWEDSIREFFAINGKLYFTHSPMHLHYYESLVTPLFNKEIAQVHQIESPYELVKEGKWTIDKMASIAQSIVTDTNGDGKMNVNDDLYGIAASTNLVMCWPLAAGCRYTDVGEDGKLVFVGNSERLVSTVEKLYGVFGGTDRMIENGDYIRLFQENHSLFFLDVLGRVKDFRSLDADFGIIPLPKFDEEQEEYISANFIGAAVLLVPTTNQAYKDIGTILEYFGAYSHRDLIPAYYEINIQGKQTRDEESVEMLEIMLSNITADLSIIYGWGGVSNLVLNSAKSGEGFASAMRSTIKVVEKSISRFYDSFEKSE